MSENERKKVYTTIVDAGYTGVKPEEIQKVPNEYDDEVYVAVVGDAMIVCAMKYSNPVKMHCF